MTVKIDRSHFPYTFHILIPHCAVTQDQKTPPQDWLSSGDHVCAQRHKSLELDPEITNLKSLLASNSVDQWSSMEAVPPVECDLDSLVGFFGHSDQEALLSLREREPGMQRAGHFHTVRNCPPLVRTSKFLLGIQIGTKPVINCLSPETITPFI